MIKNFIISGILSALIFSTAGMLFPADGFLKDTTEKIQLEMLEKGNYEVAIKKLKAVLKTYPEDSRSYAYLGIAYYGHMEYKSAYEYFKKAETMTQEKDLKRMIQYAISSMDKNRDIFKEIEDVNTAIEKDSHADRETLKEMISLGHYKILKDQMSEKYYYPALATTHITWLNKNTSGFPGLERFSAEVYYLAMLYKKAEEYYKKAVEKEPEDALLYQALADCEVALGDFDSANANYDKAVELYKKKGLEENEPLIRKLKAVQMALPRKYKDIDELIKRDAYSEAALLCKQRISLNPSDYVAITQLGEIYWLEMKKRTAMKLFTKVTRLVPDYPLAHLLLGRVYIFDRKYDKGLKEFEIFKEKMKLLPKVDEETNKFYVAALEYMSYIYFTNKDYESASRECQKIIELEPNNQKAHYNLAACYYMHYRNRQKAYDEFKKVIEIDPTSRTAASAEFYIDFMRRNPDPRIMPNFEFIYEKD